MKSTTPRIRPSLIAAVLWTPLGLWAQAGLLPAGSQPWTLPANVGVASRGSRTYHFTMDYNTAGPTGEIVQRQRVTADCTRDPSENEVEWHNVGVATVPGPTAPFPAPEKSAFMEGFHYRDDLAAAMGPDFFKSFPPAAVMERNLVWDTGMLESFARDHFDRLKLNTPLHVGAKDQDVQMPAVGTFRNHDVVLAWVGLSRRNGQNCALIEYRAFFNPVKIDSGIVMEARSDYWGELWVSLAHREIEYATLDEEVTGQIRLPGRDVAQPLSVFRIGTFEPVPAGEAGR